MGGAAIAMGAIGVAQIGMGIMQGNELEDAAELDAQNIRMAAEASVAQVNQKLDDALDMQQVVMGTQGRIQEGSTEAVIKGDKEAAARDISAIRKGGVARASATRRAGKTQRRGAIAGGILSGARTGVKASQVK